MQPKRRQLRFTYCNRRKVRMFGKVHRRSSLLAKKLSHLNTTEPFEEDVQEDIFDFSRRMVLRQHGGPIPSQRIGDLNEFYKESLKGADMLQAILTKDLDPTDEVAIASRKLLEEKFYE